MDMPEKDPVSRPYSSTRGCPTGYHHRKGYKTVKGAYVAPRCVRSTTTYKQSQKQFKASETARRRERLRGVRGALGLTKKCPKGYILRAPYKRGFAASTKAKGFKVTRGNKTYIAHPKAKSTIVQASCIKNLGLPGKGVSGQSIAPLRKGELTKYGYTVQASREDRHNSLAKAIQEFGALGVFRKLDAVAKLTKRTAPEASYVFAKDRDWVKHSYPLKAPF